MILWAPFMASGCGSVHLTLHHSQGMTHPLHSAGCLLLQDNMSGRPTQANWKQSISCGPLVSLARDNCFTIQYCCKASLTLSADVCSQGVPTL